MGSLKNVNDEGPWAFLQNLYISSMAASGRPYFEAASEKVKHMSINPALISLVNSRVPEDLVSFKIAPFYKLDADIARFVEELTGHKFTKQGQNAYFVSYLKIMFRVADHVRLTQIHEQKSRELQGTPFLKMLDIAGDLLVESSKHAAAFFGGLRQFMDNDLKSEGRPDAATPEDYEEVEAFADQFLAASMFNLNIFRMARG